MDKELNPVNGSGNREGEFKRLLKAKWTEF